jgi:hypothetical protein
MLLDLPEAIVKEITARRPLFVEDTMWSIAWPYLAVLTH